MPLRGRVVVGVKRGDLEHRPKIIWFSEFWGGELCISVFIAELTAPRHCLGHHRAAQSSPSLLGELGVTLRYSPHTLFGGLARLTGAPAPIGPRRNDT